MTSTCPQCEKRFEPSRSNARYCTRTCQSRAAAERSNAARGQAAIRNQGPGGNVVAPSAIKPLAPAYAPPLNVEWLNVFDDLHRCVAGRQNPTPKDGKSILREFAVGMDRPPLAHAILIAGEWQGRVRRKGAVIWSSERLGSLEDAKVAVERHLSGLPELVASTLALAA